MKTSIKLIGLLLSLISLATLSSCGGTSGNTGNNSNNVISGNLIPDQAASIPIVNNKQTQFYVYVYNASKDTITNLSWSIISGENSTQNNSVAGKVQNWLSDLFSSQTNTTSATTDAINFVGGSSCNNIPGNTSCRILLAANSPGSAILQGSTDNKNIITSRIISAYSYTTTNNNNDSNSLILSAIPSIVTLQDGRASFTFSVINNSSSFIDTSSLFGTLPSGISWQPVSCDNPLPSGGVCQIRIIDIASGPGASSNLQLNLNLNGTIVNPNGSTTPLPAQNSSAVVTMINTTLGNLQAGNLGLALNSNYPDSNNTTVGYIQNTGTGTTSLGRLSVGNSAAFAITNDDCSQQSLTPQAICSYTITATVANITQAGNTSIIIPYSNGISSLQALATLNYSYIAPIAPANPQISLVSPSSLNQITTSGNIIVTNTGNVALTISNGPSIVSGSTSAPVLISDPNKCTNSTLTIGANCSYLIEYAPQPPNNEDDSITIGGIRASYIDPINGGSETKTFPNTTGTNLNAVFGGLLTVSGASLTESGATSLTIQNTGNYQTIITALTVNGNNVESAAGGNCTIGETLESGASCTQKVSLIDANTPGSGNATLTVTYNTNGITNANAAGNISWVIGNQPSLYITFDPGSLLTTVGIPQTSTITLLNNGNDALSNIQFPSLTAPLSYISGGNCDLSGGESLNQNESCTAVLQYAPTIAQAQTATALGIFTASYTGGSYSTSPYINLTAVAPSALVTIPALLSPNLNWPNTTGYIQPPVTISNQSSTAAVITSITSNDPYLEVVANNCNGNTLESGGNCTFIIYSTYPTELNNYTDNGSIIISYKDPVGNSHSTVLNVSATLNMLPVVMPGLTISGSLPSSLVAGTSATTVLSLTNTSTVTNNGDSSINVSTNSLINNISNGNISASLTTSGVSNPCNPVNGIVTLTSSATCNIGLILTASGTTDGNPSYPLVTITPSFTYNVYSSQSTIPVTSGAVNAASPLTGTIAVTDPASALNISYNISSIAVQQDSLPNPTQMVITITNVGNTPTTNISLPSISGVYFSGNCGVLAINESCQVTLLVPTSNVIAASNLNSNMITFYDNYHQNGQTITFPSFPYSVNPLTTPSIAYTISTSNCSNNRSGNGLSGSTCYLNAESTTTSNIGGAGAFNLIVTYTNNSSTSAQNFIANPVTISNLTASSNCRGVTLNQGMSCSLNYTITSPTTAANLNVPALTYLDNGYSYNYGSNNQFTSLAPPTARLATQLLVTVANPSIAINSGGSILLNNTINITPVISNWYENAPPVITFSSSNPSIVTVPASCTTTLLANGGASCTITTGLFSAIGAPTITASNITPRPLTISSTATWYASSTFLYAAGYTSGAVTLLPWTGSLSSSSAPGNGPPTVVSGLSHPTGIAAYNNELYVANESSSTVTYCGLLSIAGSLTCSSSSLPFAVTLPSAAAVNNGYVYIASRNSNQIAQCSIASDNSLNGCNTLTVSAYTSGGTGGMAFNNGYVYLSNTANNAIYYCQVDVNGNFQSCAKTAITNSPAGPIGITIQTVNGTTYAYIVNSSTTAVSQCTIAVGGALSCAAATAQGLYGSVMTSLVFIGTSNVMLGALNPTVNGLLALNQETYNTTTGALISGSNSVSFTGGYGLVTYP